MHRADHVDLEQIAREAMLERGFRVEFPTRALKEAEEAREPDFGSAPKDLSAFLWTSIDNDDSRDLDQVEYLDPDAPGGPRLYVAIANVDHHVPLGSATDETARQNTTSVYTSVETFPMLPEEFSTDLSSLNEGMKRLAVVTQMDTDGEVVTGYDVYPAVITNKAQLTYNGVAAFLEGTPPSTEVAGRVLARIQASPDLQDQLHRQDALAQGLRRRRFDEGALDFDSPELRPILNADGSIELDSHDSNRATQIIEEFMVASNKSVSAYLEDSGLASIQRIVRTPKNWPRIVALAGDLGWTLPAGPDGIALQRFLAERRKEDLDRFPDLSLAVIKLLGRGEYVVKSPGEEGAGHFGLAAENYMHGSAPNRRYPDLANQRQVLSLHNGRQAPYATKTLSNLAEWCTTREGDAKKVERRVHKSIAAVALAPRIGEEFPGFITGASDKGVFVRLPHPPVEGKVEGNTRGVQVGDKVRVKLVSTDPYKGFIDFVIVGR